MWQPPTSQVCTAVLTTCLRWIRHLATAKVSAEPGIDFPTLLEQISFEPHSSGQKDYLLSEARFNLPCCGRRWGKSQAAGHRMTYKMFNPDSYNWIVGPTYSLGEKEFRVVFRDFDKLGLLKYCKKAYNVKQGDMRIQTPWGSVLQVVSAEKQSSLLGEGLSHAIMAEAAQHSRSTWEQYIEPALSDLLGSADFPSTPKGFNWYHGIWLLGQQANSSQTYHPDYKSWSFPSWTNPVRYPSGIDNTEVQRIKNIVSKVWFDQEYGASFTSVTGAIYNEWDENVHITPLEFDPRLPNYVAFDYGYVNPFVALDIQVTPGDTMHVWREYYGKHMSTMEHGQALKARPNPADYRVDCMWGDPRGADEAATLALIIGYVGSFDVPWKPSVEQIKRMLRHDNGPPRLFVDPGCVNLIREMPQLHVKPLARNANQDLNEQTSDGNIQHKVDDHCCDALRYFVGPHFVAGAGSHLSDVYGDSYVGSESQDVFTTLTGSKVTLDEELSLSGRNF